MKRVEKPEKIFTCVNFLLLFSPVWNVGNRGLINQSDRQVSKHPFCEFVSNLREIVVIVQKEPFQYQEACLSPI